MVSSPVLHLQKWAPPRHLVRSVAPMQLRELFPDPLPNEPQKLKMDGWKTRV